MNRNDIPSLYILPTVHAASLVRQGMKRDDACQKVANSFIDPTFLRSCLDAYLPGTESYRYIRKMRGKTFFK